MAEILINHYNIGGIRSQKHLGEFIEFILPSGCSVWYKKDGVYLNDSYKKAFNDAHEIQPNWYLIRKKDNVKLFELYQ